MKALDLLGGRVFKTGVAVFLTAVICMALDWSPVFAVITAIVTLEPTVSDSIRKGIVRFPASVIGSGYAVILIAYFGNSAITYTLAAVLTILTCFKLKLHEGLLVATLTAVTMVEVIDSNYLLAFLTRLGTTSIGLLVSTGVNMFVLPPDYRDDISDSLRNVKKMTISNIKLTFSRVLKEDNADKKVIMHNIRRVAKSLTKAEQFVRFQKEESRYHPLLSKDERQLNISQESLTALKMINYHLANLNQVDFTELAWTEKESKLIETTIKDLEAIFKSRKNFNDSSYKAQLARLTTEFYKNTERTIERNSYSERMLPEELIVLYELMAIYQQVEQLYPSS